MGKNAAVEKASNITAGQPVTTTWELCDAGELMNFWEPWSPASSTESLQD